MVEITKPDERVEELVNIENVSQIEFSQTMEALDDETIDYKDAEEDLGENIVFNETESVMQENT